MYLNKRVMPTQESFLRTQFLDYVFGEKEGYICLATGTAKRNGRKEEFYQEFFKWPSQKAQATAFIEGARSKNVWFCVNLLTKAERKKEFCLPTDTVWADLDNCSPDIITPKPSLVMETSPDRFQALWKLDEDVPPAVAEEYSRRIFSKYRADGVDSGWALTKLLRVPFTVNFKYTSLPTVQLLYAEDETINSSVFESILIEELTERGEDVELPDLINLPSAEQVVYAYRHALSKTAFADLYSVEPDEDWSGVLWRLIKLCLESGMSKEETFVVASQAKCNKYERDKRPIRHLWLDVVKADTIDKTFAVLTGDKDNELVLPEIVSEDEVEKIKPTWINDYVEWASSVTDANKEYHEISGAILLSSVLADKLHLKVRWGNIIPNLWGLVLGESTITRKSTAMELAVEFIREIDPQLILSTQDSSVEGMLTALEKRPEKVSIFYRDELSGFFNAMRHKSYLAGMAEMLTKLYDVPPHETRQLRKETITIIKPIFIFFGGGIQERVYEALDDDFFYSGFLPRFLVVNGEANIDNLDWIGPPVHNVSAISKDGLRADLHSMVNNYRTQVIKTTLLGQDAEITKEVEVVLTDDAWNKMRSIEQLLVKSANSSSMSGIALPTFTRMSTSILKLAMLIGASRQEPKDLTVTVEEHDVIHAAHFVQKWSTHSIDMMLNIGTTTSERMIQRVLALIRRKPGITRAECMRRHHLQSVEARSIFLTLEERGVITQKQSGRGYTIWPV